MSTGYGLDTWCLDSLSPGRYARGATLVAQALYRRLITPRGTLRGGDDAGTYGFDVSSYLGAVGTEIALAALPGLVVGELSKDDRVSPGLTCAITSSTDSAGEVSIQLSIDVTLADESESFTLTLLVTNVTTTIIGGLP